MVLGCPQVARTNVSYALLRLRSTSGLCDSLASSGPWHRAIDLRNTIEWGQGKFDEAAGHLPFACS